MIIVTVGKVASRVAELTGAAQTIIVIVRRQVVFALTDEIVTIGVGDVGVGVTRDFIQDLRLIAVAVDYIGCAVRSQGLADANAINVVGILRDALWIGSAGQLVFGVVGIADC